MFESKRSNDQLQTIARLILIVGVTFLPVLGEGTLARQLKAQDDAPVRTTPSSSDRITPGLDDDPLKEPVNLPGRRPTDSADTGPRVIRPGDRIQIEVGGEDWGGTYQVPRNGEIDFRFLGTVDVSGKTTRELTQKLKKPLRDYYRRPDLIVNFVEIKTRAGPPPIFFGGHVVQKGSITPNEPISFARAIALVGGFSKEANPKKTRILRRDNRIEVINGFKHQDPSRWKGIKPFTLHPGDYVYVPGERFRKETVPPKIYFSGAVESPGSGTLEEPLPFGAAIAKTAGGFTDNAELTRVQITRATGDTLVVDGQKQLQMSNLPRSQRIMIRPGDYIYVPTQESEQIEVTVLGAVGKPQKVKLTRGDGVMDALVKAGSINQNSDRWKMFVFRKVKKETVIKHASYSRYVRGDLSQNVPLRDGDVVYVRTRFWPYFDTLNQVLRTIGITTQSALDIEDLERIGE